MVVLVYISVAGAYFNTITSLSKDDGIKKGTTPTAPFLLSIRGQGGSRFKCGDDSGQHGDGCIDFSRSVGDHAVLDGRSAAIYVETRPQLSLKTGLPYIVFIHSPIKQTKISFLSPNGEEIKI